MGTVSSMDNMDIRMVPFALSGLGLLFQLFYFTSKTFGRHRCSLKFNFSQRIQDLGGKTIFVYMTFRLLGCIVLLSLSALTVAGCKVGLYDLRKAFITCPELFLTTSFLSSTIFSTISLISQSYGSWSTRLNTILLISILMTYLYRDIWPLATTLEYPADTEEGMVLYIKLLILTVNSCIIPAFMPRRYVPVDPKNPMPLPNPEQTSSIFSMMTYTFLDPVIFLGYRVPHLDAQDLPPLSDHDMARYRIEKALPYFSSFRKDKNRSLFWTLMRVYRKEYTILAFMLLCYSITGFAAPIGINRVLNYLETEGVGEPLRPWFWILWLLVGPMLQSLSFQWYIFICTRTLVRTEGLITQLVFDHSLRIRLKAETSEDLATSVQIADQVSLVDSTATSGKDDAKQNTAPTEPSPSNDKHLIGKINNLVTSDLRNIVSARDFLVLVVYTPIQITLCMAFLYNVLGWSSLVGVGVMLLMISIPGIVASKIQQAQLERMKRTDARVEATAEIINIIRMVKLFGWENKISKRLDGRREDELRWVLKVKLWDELNWLLGYLYPILTMIATYSLYTIVMNEVLTPSKIFSSIVVFNTLRQQFHWIAQHAVLIIQGKVSLDRVQDFLMNTELLDQLPRRTTQADSPPSTELGFRNATFSWTAHSRDGSLTPSKRAFRLQIKHELIFKRNSINLITGPTGSGKTSLLMALLGEMHFIPSDSNSWFNLPREGGVAYASQESWVQNDTIRNNIVFRTPYHEERYRKVVKQCALERDLELFAAGDATEVGERGLTLSGGQKARVTLARAIYSFADVVLLDDIFAALDVHTSTWIVQHCFKGDLVKGRTILLVTHNIALAGPIADFIVSIGADGRIKSQVTEIAPAIQRDLVLAAHIELNSEIRSARADEDPTPTNETTALDGKLMAAEEIAKGHVTWKSFKLMLSSFGGNHPVLLYSVILVFLVAFQWLYAFQSWFLGYWGSQYERKPPSEVKASFYIGAYAGIASIACIVNMAAYLIALVGSMRTSRIINKKLVGSVIQSTFRWLDTTPTSRIIARCTQDIVTIDNELPSMAMWIVDTTIGILTKLGAVVLFTPLFLLPGLGVGVLGFYLGNMYLRSQLSVKREQSNARSPLLSNFNAAIHGLVSIRAYGAQEYFKDQSLIRIDHYTRVARVTSNLNRWISVRMDFLGALFTSSLAFYLVYGSSPGASNAGFSLTMAAELATFIFALIRLANDFEVNANSLERIQSYLDIDHEPPEIVSGVPPAAWPTSGDLRVEHLYARYSEGGPVVLNDISFHIASGQRVGVVGRTGSGKSSLMLSLLRCIPTEGAVYYDGLLTRNLNLDALRSKITIIPQTPELLSGTLRQNLDPFEQYDDATLNNALRSSGLFSSLGEGDADGGQGGEVRLTLDSMISGAGSNLSVGQRQIIALARAMVRDSKLLILDEATSAIDYKTDSIIQNTLRTELAGDVTVITVAHRLQTVMDSDMIMVLDGGNMVELGKPKDLLSKKSGVLRALVEDSGDKETLYALAGFE